MFLLDVVWSALCFSAVACGILYVVAALYAYCRSWWLRDEPGGESGEEQN